MTPVGDFIGDQRRTAGVDAAYRTIAECTTQIDAGRDFIVLVLSHRQAPTGEKARLTTSGGPLGEILCYHPDRLEIVARFKPVAVRKFLRKLLDDNGWDT
jgi:hypothetical protein